MLTLQNAFTAAAQWAEQKNIGQYMLPLTGSSAITFGLCALANGFMGQDVASNACITGSIVSGLWFLRELGNVATKSSTEASSMASPSAPSP